MKNTIQILKWLSLSLIFVATTFAQPVIQVIAPKSGETWETCSLQDIRYQILGASNSLRCSVEISYDNGATWNQNPQTLLGGHASFSVPSDAPATTQARIRISSSSTLSGVSSLFSIVKATINPIEITNPSPIQTQKSKFNSNNIFSFNYSSQCQSVNSRYQIDLSTNGGANWIVLQTTSSTNFSFTPPSVITQNAQLRVSDLEFPSQFYYSSFFEFFNPNLYNVLLSTSPTVNACSSVEILASFREDYDDFFRGGLEYSTDGGLNWLTYYNDFYFYSNSTRNFFYISNATHLFRYKSKDGKYTSPSISVTPNNNSTIGTIKNGSGYELATRELFSGGNNINWDLSNGCAKNYKIEYSLDNGVNWVVSNSNYSSNYYLLVLPTVSSNIINGMVKVSQVSNPSIFSTGTFVLMAQNAPIQILTPILNQSVSACNSMNISWKRARSNTYYYNLDISTNGGANWIPVSQYIYGSNATNSTSLYINPNWRGNNTKIRISETLNRGSFGISDVFPIVTGTANYSFFNISNGRAFPISEASSIRWNTNNGCSDRVKIELSLNGGTTYSTLTNSIQNIGIFNFTFTGANISNQARLKISDVANPSSSSESNIFTISNKSIRISQVATQMGYNNLYLTYTATGFTNWPFYNSSALNAELSTNGGTSWSNITDLYVGNSPLISGFSLIIPNVNTTNAIVRLKLLSNPAIFAQTPEFRISSVTQTFSFSTNNGLSGNPSSVEAWSTRFISFSNSIPSLYNINFEYTTNNGATWTSISSNLNTVFEIPNIPGTYRLRAISTEGVIALANSSFTVTPAPVNFTNLNASSVRSPCGSNSFAWSVSGANFSPSSASISYNGGRTWTLISGNYGFFSGNQFLSFSFLPGLNQTSNQVVVKVSDNANGKFIRSALFTLTVASASPVVTFPNGLNSFNADNPINFSFNSGFSSCEANLTYNLDLTTNNGVSWSRITSNLKNTFFAFKAPNIGSSACRVRVSRSDNPSLFDESNSNFTIIAKPTPSITVNPTGPWNACTNNSLSWNAVSTSNLYNVDLSLDNGATWFRLVSSYSSTSYSYNVPNSVSSTAKIRVTDCFAPSITSQSNTFVIQSSSPTINITFPLVDTYILNEAEKFIEWEKTSCTEAVKIDYTLDGGNTWFLLNSKLTNNYYYWNVPSIITSTNAGLRITDINNPSVTTSIAGFKIGAPYMKLLFPKENDVVYSGISYNSSIKIEHIGLYYSTNNYSGVALEISTNGGTTWGNKRSFGNIIDDVTSLTTTNGTYTFPSLATTTSALARIVSSGNSDVWYTFTTPFTIAKPEYTFPASISGLTLIAGNDFMVTVTRPATPNASSTTLSYSVAGINGLTSIANIPLASFINNVATVNWTNIPSITSTLVSFYAQDDNNALIKGSSATFIIENQGISTLTGLAASYAPGSSAVLPYTSFGTFNSGNQFILDIVDAISGNSVFASISTVTSLLSGTFTTTIPSSLNIGTYKMKVRSTNPGRTFLSNSFSVTDPFTFMGNPSGLLTQGSSFNLPFTINSNTKFNGANQFIVDLYNSAGNSIVVSNIGNLYGITSSSVLITIPNNVSQGSYTVRIRSTSPVHVKQLLSNPFTISDALSAPTVSAGACAGTPQSVTVPVNPIVTFTPGNIFTAELSDQFGAFTTPVVLGSVSASGISVTSVNGILPSGLATGSNYRIRIKSSNPVAISPSSNAFPIQALCMTATTSGSYCSNDVMNVYVNVTGPVAANNNYIIKMSGYYASDMTLGTFASSLTGNIFVPVTIPSGLFSGGNYQVKVVTTSPYSESNVSLVTMLGNLCEIGTPQSLGTICAGNAINGSMYVNTSVAYNPGNAFTMSISSNNFATSTLIGTFISTVPGNIAYTIPAGFASGASYSLKIGSSNPARTSNPSSSFTIFSACVPAGSPSVSQVCAGNTISVTSSITGTMNAGNVYTLEMSDAGAGFSNPITIGTLNSVATGTITIPALIPSTTPSSGYYAYRVRSSNPVSLSVNSSNYLTISRVCMTTGSVMGSASACPGGTIQVPFNSPTAFNPGNSFIVELSDLNGNFYNNSQIGSFATTLNPVTFNPALPTGLPSGTGYKVRVLSTDPYSISTPSPNTITVNNSYRWIGGTVGNLTEWNVPTNWSCTLVPTVNTDALIPATTLGANWPNITTNDAVCKTLIVQSGATLNMANNTALSVYGNFDMAGTFAPLANSTVNFSGSSIQNIMGTTTGLQFRNININNGAFYGVTAMRNISVSENFTNNGNAASYLSNGYTTSFNGTTAQLINGSASSIMFDDLIINSSPIGVTSTINMFVKGSFTNQLNSLFNSDNTLMYFNGTALQNIFNFALPTSNVKFGTLNFNNNNSIVINNGFDVRGDFRRNLGSLNILAAGDLAFTGTTVTQTIETNNQPLSFASLNFNNPMGIVLSSSTSINVKETFNNDALFTGDPISTVSFGGIAIQAVTGLAGNSTRFGTVLFTNSLGVNVATPISIRGLFRNIAGFNTSSDVIFDGSTPQNLNLSNDLIPTFQNLSLLASNVTLNTPMISKGNFTNNGTFLVNNQNVTFSGTNTQGIGGSSVTTLFCTNFSNPAGYSMTNNVLTNTITMVSGIAQLNSSVFTITNPTNGALQRTDGHFVGQLNRALTNANGSYLFPVGTPSRYRGANVNFTDPVTGYTGLTSNHFDIPATSQVFPANFADNGIPLVTTFDNYWKFEPIVSVTGGTYTITLDAQLNTSTLAGASDLRIIKRADSSSPWALFGTHGSANFNVGTQTLTISRVGISGFSEFAIAGSCSNVARVSQVPQISQVGLTDTLQVNLNSTTYSWFRDGNALQNTTKKLKALTKGKYVAQAVINGCTTDGSLEFTFDPTPFVKNNLASGLADGNVNLYPNPASEIANLKITNFYGETVKIELVSSMGSLMFSTSKTINSDLYEEAIDLSNLSSGIYQVKVISNKGTFSSKLVVVK